MLRGLIADRHPSALATKSSLRSRLIEKERTNVAFQRHTRIAFSE